MSHAQTNLQLYRQAIEASWDEASLATLRRAYELALQLFADSYRTSRRPFVAHLVGTASTLLAWKQRPSLVIAGVLHSAYAMGHFGDGERGVTPQRRRCVENAVGPEIEQLIHDFAATKSEDQLTEWCQAKSLSPREHDLVTMQIANLFDDCRDGEPLLAPTKKRTLGLPWNEDARQSVIQLAERSVDKVAAEELRGQFAELDSFKLPDCLRMEKHPERRVISGIAELRPSVVQRCLRGIARLAGKKRAA